MVSLLLLPTRRRRDSFFSKVVFLANFNSAISDLATGKVITVTGPPVISNAHPFAGLNSCAFDGTAAACLTMATSADWTLNVPFCVEGWAWIDSSKPSTNLIDLNGINGANWQSFSLWVDGSAKFNSAVSSNSSSGGDIIINSTSAFGSVPMNAWNHYALSWDGTTYRVFLNGTIGYSKASTTAMYNSGNGIMMGAYPLTAWNNPVNGLKGALGPHRITKGVPRYTANFNPRLELFPTR